jgi:hypothetical protein
MPISKILDYKRLKFHAAAALLVLSLLASLLVAHRAGAAGFDNAYIRLDRQAASTATTGLVCVNPGSTSADVKTWSITFPTGFTVTDGGSGANWSTTNISTSGIPTGTSAWPNATSASAAASGQTVTWTNSSAQTMTNGTTYCYRWTSSSALSTGSAGVNKTGTITTKNSSAVTIDSSPWATAVISNDQITVSATVPATFTFVLGGNSDSFTTNLDPTANSVSTSGVTAQVITNALHGYIAWVKSANAALTSATRPSDPINTAGTVNGSPNTLSAGSDGYVLDVDETVDTDTNGTIDGEYNGGANAGGTLSTSYQPIFSGTSATSGYTATLVEKASISATHPPASDFTDTLTVVSAGQF